MTHNAAEKGIKAAQLEKERDFDRQLLEATLAKEKAIQEIEEAERLQRRKEVIELQQYYKQAEKEKGDYEKLVDEFVQEEAERQFKMRESQWQREQQARINLMKEVYDSREKDILLKKEKKKELEWHKAYEKEQSERAIAEQNAQFEEKAAKEVTQRKTHQMDLLKQMNEKDRVQRQYLQEKMYEERAAKLAELEYQRKINQDK